MEAPKACGAETSRYPANRAGRSLGGGSITSVESKRMKTPLRKRNTNMAAAARRKEQGLKQATFWLAPETAAHLETLRATGRWTSKDAVVAAALAKLAADEG